MSVILCSDWLTMIDEVEGLSARIQPNKDYMTEVGQYHRTESRERCDRGLKLLIVPACNKSFSIRAITLT